MLAPIIVFAYNRPEHLRKTLTWLSQNEHADESVLYIYCDGAKDNASPEQLEKVLAAREVARSKQWCKEVHIVESEKNKGLGTSIISGVTEIVNQYGKVIVLEDDLQTSPLFLDYMNKCLDHYETRKTVFSISGLSRPHPERFYPADYPYDVYVSLTHHPTGWATWEDRWKQVDWSAQNYKVLQENENIRRAFMRGGEDWWDELRRQQENHLNIWSVRFCLAHFENHAVSICPIVSYINHIGWDCEATNAIGGGDRWRFERLADKKEIRFVDILYEDDRIINSWYSFSISRRRSLWGKLVNYIGRKWLKKDEFYLKGKVYV